MSFDLNQIAPQIEKMTHSLRQAASEKERHIQTALELFKWQNRDLAGLKARLASARTSWLVAGIEQGLSDKYPLPAFTRNYSVLATDGSHIDVDRHIPVRCYLINIGQVMLNYGKSPSASLSNTPLIYFDREDMVIANPLDSNEEQMIEGPLLGIKRMVRECSALYEVTSRDINGQPALAILDGSLILWGLAGKSYPDYVKKFFLEEGIIKCLDDFRKLAENKTVTLSSYISRPRSNDVVNILRIAACPQPEVNCDKYCSSRKPAEKECSVFNDIDDNELFSRLLAGGERSEVFTSLSSISKSYLAENEIQFFYIKIEDEIARVEFPRWAGRKPELLDMMHAIVFDQCVRGKGYPVALSEAHEQAVLSASDREQFNFFLEYFMSDYRFPFSISAKRFSKRTRWI